MTRWTWLLLFLASAIGAGADEPEPGRTDGPEGSEYGKGGYSFLRGDGHFYLEGFFGAAQVDIKPEGAGDNSSTTDLIFGANVGYQFDYWLSFRAGFGHIADQNIDLFSAGVRGSYDQEPINYFLSLDAELFKPEVGEDRFGIVPGVGVEAVVHDKLSVGLGYQHDFIFSDDSVDIDRFTARLMLSF